MTSTRIPKKAHRRIYFVDFENLAGTPSPTIKEVANVVNSLRDALPDFDQAQRIVACSHHAAPSVSFAFPGARHLWRSGPDGADLALLDVMENERIDARYGHVTICSGDGIFADRAARFGGAGIDVTVVSVRGRLSARLQLAARHVLYLDRAPAQASKSAC